MIEIEGLEQNANESENDFFRRVANTIPAEAILREMLIAMPSIRTRYFPTLASIIGYAIGAGEGVGDAIVRRYLPERKG